MIKLVLIKGINGKKAGEIIYETNNVAHSLIENKIAEKYKEFENPVRDKMMRKNKTKKL